MAARTAWDDVQQQLPDLRRADCVIGLPTFNNAAAVPGVVRAVTEGLRRACPDASVLLITADAGSQDGTPALIKEAVGGAFPVAQLGHQPGASPALPPLSELWSAWREEAFRAFFEVTRGAEARACVVLDPAVRSMAPEWIGWLLGPILEQHIDYVAPVFQRPRYEGSLTNGLIYPLNRALYGVVLRYHTGGGYGISGALAALYLDRDLWEGEAARYGIDNWLTTVAVAEGRAVCQAGLGERRMDTGTPSEDLASLLAQAVGSVFSCMERYQDVWEGRTGLQTVPFVGLPYRSGPDRTPINVDRMIRGFRQGLRDLVPIWEMILSPETLSGILPLGLTEADDFRFPGPLWAQAVYDFALAYHEKVLHRDHLLKSLTPLYLGWVASLVRETREGKPEDAEAAIEQLCETFAHMKPYLVERWRFS